MSDPHEMRTPAIQMGPARVGMVVQRVERASTAVGLTYRLFLP
jgi:hypothetical protein